MEEVLVRAKARDKATPLHLTYNHPRWVTARIALQGHLAHGFTRSAQLVISFLTSPKRVTVRGSGSIA